MISRMPAVLTISNTTNQMGSLRREECHNANPFQNRDQSIIAIRYGAKDMSPNAPKIPKLDIIADLRLMTIFLLYHPHFPADTRAYFLATAFFFFIAVAITSLSSTIFSAGLAGTILSP